MTKKLLIQVPDCGVCPFEHGSLCIHPHTTTRRVGALDVPPSDCGLRDMAVVVALTNDAHDSDPNDPMLAVKT